MKIQRVRLLHIPVQLTQPLRTSDGTHQSRVATVVEITDDRGCVGWGENVAPTGVAYVGESHDASVKAMRDMCIPLITGREIDVREMMPETWWGFAGNNFAKHGVESALWDIEAQRNNMSLASLLGGERTSITPGVVVGLADTIDDVVQECVLRIRQGYTRIKVKVAPTRDSEVLKAVRTTIGDDVVLQADANGAYTHDDLNHLMSFARFNLQFVEQPFASGDIASHVALMQSGAIAVCLDESLTTADELVAAVDAGACSVVNVKPSRIGGIGEACRWHDIVRSRGVDAWVGGMLETGIGRASCIAVASLPGFTLTPDLSASERYFIDDITEPFCLENGTISVPTGPGIGVEVLREVFESPTTRIETVFEC